MDVEIETKLKVDSLDEVESKLRDAGAEFVAEQHQLDEQFDDANKGVSSTDQCLRIRRQVVNGSETYILTYKGKKESSNIKKRREIEVEVCDAEALKKILSALGYEPVLSVEKVRRLWKLGGCEVALDRLPQLGQFVEIEGPDDQSIAAVKDTLGLSELKHIKRSYAGMVALVLGKNELKKY